MRPPRVVVRSAGRERSAEVSLAEDQHPVGEFGADGQHEAFGEAVRAWTPWRDLDHLDPCIGQHRVERGRELSGPVADEEPKPGGVVAEVHHEVAGLLGRPGPVGMRGHAENVQVAVADLEHEQDVEPPQGERAVDGRSRRRACWWPGCAGIAASWYRCAGPVPVGSGGAAGSAGSSRRPRGGRVRAARPGSARTPSAVLPCHPHHQGEQDVLDRWPSGPVGAGPSARQPRPAALPSLLHNTARINQPPGRQRSGAPHGRACVHASGCPRVLPVAQPLVEVQGSGCSPAVAVAGHGDAGGAGEHDPLWAIRQPPVAEAASELVAAPQVVFAADPSGKSPPCVAVAAVEFRMKVSSTQSLGLTGPGR